MTTVTTARARLAAKSRHHPDASLAGERATLQAAVAETHVRRIVDAAPPLTIEQRARLAAILLGPTGGEAA